MSIQSTPPLKKAAIDIGSNSVLLQICEVSKKNKNEEGQESEISILQELDFQSTITSLGSNLVSSKKLDSLSKQKTLEALKKYKATLDHHHINTKDVLVSGTEAFRVAEDRYEFIELIKSQTGFQVIPITSDGEAYYTLKGVLSNPALSKNDHSAIIMDMGGSSTELIKFDAETKTLVNSISIPIGAVKARDIMERYATQESTKSLNDIFDSLSASDLENYGHTTIIGVAGTLTSIAAISIGSFDSHLINKTTLSIHEFHTILEQLRLLSNDEIKTKYSFLNERTPFIVPGMIAISLLIKKLKTKSFLFCSSGLRHGLICSDSIKEKFVYSSSTFE